MSKDLEKKIETLYDLYEQLEKDLYLLRYPYKFNILDEVYFNNIKYTVTDRKMDVSPRDKNFSISICTLYTLYDKKNEHTFYAHEGNLESKLEIK